MDRRAGCTRGDLHRRVLAARRRAADEQRRPEPAPLHLLRHEHHFVERRRDQAAQPDEVGLLVDRGLQDPVGGHHHAEIDHLVAVAAEHDADDVLADVVDIALDRRHDDPSLAASAALPAVSCSMNGCRYATAFFIARALLTTCGRNILPAPNRSPTTFMPSIKRALDDRRAAAGISRALPRRPLR